MASTNPLAWLTGTREVEPENQKSDDLWRPAPRVKEPREEDQDAGEERKADTTADSVA